MRIGKQKVELLYPQSYEELTEKLKSQAGFVINPSLRVILRNLSE